MPACIAEQIISLACESLTTNGTVPNKSNAKPYRECLFGEGSSFEEEQDACLKCKADMGRPLVAAAKYLFKAMRTGNKAYKEAKEPSGSAWSSTEAVLDWNLYNDLVKSSNSTKELAAQLDTEVKFGQQTKPQSRGTFTLNGTTYPAADQLAGVPTDAFKCVGAIPELSMKEVQVNGSMVKVLSQTIHLNLVEVNTNGEVTFGAQSDTKVVDSSQTVKGTNPSIKGIKPATPEQMIFNAIAHLATQIGPINMESVNKVRKEAAKITGNSASTTGSKKVCRRRKASA
ncbi:Desumoylating isopeptidase 1 [Purpureocillium lavendulum]|uniref:Desumoylating isopeptidase 1 n=1 Tax=Purpureocillium lavendulum TaxID=1247861 RepID=A0AB34FH84_9HYPO|nr:Desumoylating isopeptidase 1 [Purpureocillium lavendulum]